MKCSFALLGRIHGEREALHTSRGISPVKVGARGKVQGAQQDRNVIGPGKAQASPSHLEQQNN